MRRQVLATFVAVAACSLLESGAPLPLGAADLAASQPANLPASQANGRGTGAKPEAPKPGAKPVAPKPAPIVPPAGVKPPLDYVIGPDDILSIVFWREKDVSGDVAVRPDGKISLPLINEVQAAGLTPDQLKDALAKAAEKYLEDPNVTVMVKEIRSRKVFITGQIGKPGAYPLHEHTTVLQLIAMAGGLHEFADSEQIAIVRNENGRDVRFRFNYNDVRKGKNLRQNIPLKPGDTIVVP